MTLTLNSPITEEQWDMIEDVDFDHTDSITFYTKHGKEVEFVKRKAGKWIYGENKYGHDGWQCDQCGHWILWDYHVSMEDAERDLPKYCPHCGARMAQEGEEHE